MDTQARSVVMTVTIPGSDKQGTAQLSYEECTKCGAILIGASPLYVHRAWHAKIDVDTETYKRVLDEANELVKELKGLRARMPRMT